MQTPVPLLQVALFLGVAIGWRAWVQRRLHGTSGIVVFRSARTFDLARDLSLLALPVLLVGAGIAAWRAPELLEFTGPIAALRGPHALQGGVVVTSLAVALIVTAQVQMGGSWRVGIDDGARPGLVTHGLFAFCRNPIYLGMYLWHTGFVLSVPTWGNVAVLAAMLAVIPVQVRREERYLLDTYGDEFRAYAARTGRFLPALGLLSS